jgi:hypothetical protein
MKGKLRGLLEQYKFGPLRDWLDDPIPDAVSMEPLTFAKRT